MNVQKEVIYVRFGNCRKWPGRLVCGSICKACLPGSSCFRKRNDGRRPDCLYRRSGQLSWISTGVEKTEEGWQIQLESGESIETKSIILASGAMHRKLGVPGEKELAGAGVSYCATCDGAFFKDKTVAVVGGGDVAIEDALYLAKMCKQVYLVHRRQGLRATQVLQEQMKNTPNITFLPDREVKRIIGEQKVEKIELNNKAKNEPEELAVDGVFVAIGMEPQAAAYANVLTLEGGYVPAGEDCTTQQPGLFVAGDVRTKKLRQIVTAVSDGANAVASAVDYLTKRKKVVETC